MSAMPAASARSETPSMMSAGRPERLRARMTRGVAWNLTGAAFNQGSTFVVNIILANLWGLRTFGEYAIVQSTFSVVASMAQLATGYTATKYVAELRSHDPDRTGRVLGLCAFVSTVTAGLAGAVMLIGADRLSDALKAPQLAPALMIAAGGVFFSVMNGFLMGGLAGLESYPALGRVGIASGVVYVALCAAGAWTGGLQGAVAGVALSGFVQWMLLGRMLRAEAARQGIVVRIRSAWRETRVLWRFGTPAALNGLIALPAIWAANAFLVREDQGYDQMALFAAANNFRIAALFVPNIINNVGMSLLNSQRGAGDEHQYRRVYCTNLLITAAVVLIGAGGVALVGNSLIGVFGEEFHDGYSVVPVLMIATVAEGLSLAAFQPILSQERLWLGFVAVVMPCYAALVVFAHLLTLESGAVGLAWAYVAGWTIALFAETVVVWRIGVWARAEDPGGSL